MSIKEKIENAKPISLNDWNDGYSEGYQQGRADQLKEDTPYFATDTDDKTEAKIRADAINEYKEKLLEADCNTNGKTCINCEYSLSTTDDYRSCYAKRCYSIAEQVKENK